MCFYFKETKRFFFHIKYVNSQKKISFTKHVIYSLHMSHEIINTYLIILIFEAFVFYRKEISNQDIF